MIGIYATPDAALDAAAIAAAIGRAWPDLTITTSNESPLADLPYIGAGGGAGGSAAWDDLLLIAFGRDPLPADLHGPLAAEVAAAAREQRPSRVLPVSTLPDQRRPPVPLDTVKAIPCLDPDGAEGANLARRVGALLWLALRGTGRRIFVSHRQADGQRVAAQVTAWLNAQGYHAWRDEERLEGGEVVQDEIARTIAATHTLLLLDTPKARQSEWVWREIDMAIAGFVPVVPIVLRPARSADGPGFRSAADMDPHRVSVGLDAAGVCEPLLEADLAGLLASMEEHLGRLLRMQRTLADKVRASFQQAGFDWRISDEHRHLFVGSRPDPVFAQLRMLAHCSAVSPRILPAVRALQGWQPVGDAPGRFNYRLFVYEPPMPDPELERLVAAHQFDQDAQLRLFDTDQLAHFLARYRSAPET